MDNNYIKPQEIVNTEYENFSDWIDAQNWKNGNCQEPEQYKDINNTTQYDLLHDIINIICESNDPHDLLKKLELLTRIVISITEKKKESKQNVYNVIILLRLKGVPLKQIAERIGWSDVGVMKYLETINEAKIKIALKECNKINLKIRQSGRKTKYGV